MALTVTPAAADNGLKQGVLSPLETFGQSVANIAPTATPTVVIPIVIIFYPFRISAVWVVGVWFAMQLFSAAASTPDSPGVAWWAHIGGFAAGLMLTPFLKSSHVPFFGPRTSRGPWG